MTNQPTGASDTRADNNTDDFFEIYHGTYATRIRPQLAAFAIAARVTTPDTKFDDLITQAIVGCVFQHRVIRLKRVSEHVKDLLRVRGKARAAALSIRKLESEVKTLDHYLFSFIRDSMSAEDVASLECLAAEAGRHAHLAKLAETIAFALRDRDPGGPNQMIALQVLVKGLARAFRHGRKKAAAVTRRAEGYGGDFMALVRVVLPLAIALAEEGGAARLDRPAPESLGAYVERIAKSVRPKEGRPVETF